MGCHGSAGKNQTAKTTLDNPVTEICYNKKEADSVMACVWACYGLSTKFGADGLPVTTLPPKEATINPINHLTVSAAFMRIHQGPGGSTEHHCDTREFKLHV